jgi:hypothetical protein
MSFISKMWGGRISDKELTGKTRFYDYIEFGDQVMAHRGFAISTELAQRGATLVMPPFTNLKVGSSCLVLLLRARQLSALRIHTERAIERIKNFCHFEKHHAFDPSSFSK